MRKELEVKIFFFQKLEQKIEHKIKREKNPIKDVHKEKKKKF